MIASSWIGLAPGDTSAQRRRAPSVRERATSALATADLSACGARPEWAARTVRVGLVVLPGGEWGLAVASVIPELPRADGSALTHCLETAVRQRLGDRVPLPPRAALVVTRDLELPGSASLAAAITPRIDTQRATVDACVRERSEARLARIDLAARVEVQGGRVTAIASLSEDPASAAAACIGPALETATDLPDGAAVIAITVHRGLAPAGTLPRHDGTEGAVCAWGELDRSRAGGRHVLPEPTPCRAGLQCCYGGGIAGLSSGCMSVGRSGCPMYP